MIWILKHHGKVMAHHAAWTPLRAKPDVGHGRQVLFFEPGNRRQSLVGPRTISRCPGRLLIPTRGGRPGPVVLGRGRHRFAGRPKGRLLSDRHGPFERDLGPGEVTLSLDQASKVFEEPGIGGPFFSISLLL